MAPGRAVELGSAGHRQIIPVSKQYEVEGGRRFIVERIPYLWIRGELSKLLAPSLPTNAPGTTVTNGSVHKETRWLARAAPPLPQPVIGLSGPAQKPSLTSAPATAALVRRNPPNRLLPPGHSLPARSTP